MNAAAPEGTPPRRINDIKKFKRELRDPPCLERSPEAEDSRNDMNFISVSIQFVVAIFT
jgi:hypothetical protein